MFVNSHQGALLFSLNTAGGGGGQESAYGVCLWHLCTHVCWWFGLSVMPTLETSRTVACQTPLSMGFSRREYRRGLPFPSPGDLPDPGIEPTSPALAGGSLSLSHQGSPTPPLTATLHPHPFICHPSFPFWVQKGAESSKKTHQDHETNIEPKILPPGARGRTPRWPPLSFVVRSLSSPAPDADASLSCREMVTLVLSCLWASSFEKRTLERRKTSKE